MSNEQEMSLLKMEGESPSKRLALTIGNTEYENLPSLANVENDTENVKNKLESLNLTATAADDEGVLPFRHKKGLQHLYLFGTKATQPEASGANTK